jgi:hypothetical protein
MTISGTGVQDPPFLPDLHTVLQDIYRRLGAPMARGGLLRLRTSPDVRVARAFGHLFPDDQFENLFHVISAVRGVG